MPYAEVLEVETYHPQIRPVLESYDSGQECSLEHLRELYRLLEAEDHALDGYVFDDSCLGTA